MPVIKTKRNRVIADEPGPGDTHVQVGWLAPSQDGKHTKQFHGPVTPADEYRAAVSWAVGMADQFEREVYVRPMTGVEALRTEYMQRAIAGLTDEQRDDLRRLVLGEMAAIMRDSDDRTVRADAYRVLVDMGVVR